ncbi:MAG TPA: response regulator transcription factor [Geobacteraceae bacterium]|nr:response regulator transcription factor [Geobacteraceae bacterium]
MLIRLVLADDHPLILSGLNNLFMLEQDMEVLASCTSGSEALKEVRQSIPDVVLLDIRMPGMTGLDVARAIRQEGLPTRIVLLTATLEDAEMIAALQLGVDGIVLKEMAPQLLVQCIRKVHSGEQWVERNASRQALERMLKKESGEREVATLLTPREIDLVRMVAAGLRNREIGEKLFISEGTVKVHLHNIYEKLKVDGRMALSRYAREKGLV